MPNKHTGEERLSKKDREAIEVILDEIAPTRYLGLDKYDNEEYERVLDPEKLAKWLYYLSLK